MRGSAEKKRRIRTPGVGEGQTPGRRKAAISASLFTTLLFCFLATSLHAILCCIAQMPAEDVAFDMCCIVVRNVPFNLVQKFIFIYWETLLRKKKKDYKILEPLNFIGIFFSVPTWVTVRLIVSVL
jgi:hypothetical protein